MQEWGDVGTLAMELQLWLDAAAAIPVRTEVCDSAMACLFGRYNSIDLASKHKLYAQ